MNSAFGPEFWRLFDNPRFDPGRVLADLRRAASPSSVAFSPPRIVLQDGSPCYYRNHFFELDVRATIDVQGPEFDFHPLLARPSLVDRYGTYGAGASSRTRNTHVHRFNAVHSTASGTLTMPTPNGEDQLPLVFANRAPVLTSLVAKAGTIVVAGAPRNSAVTLVANVTDPDGDKLHFTWAVNAGSIGAINDNTAQWILPDSPRHRIRVCARDRRQRCVPRGLDRDFDRCRDCARAAGRRRAGGVFDPTRSMPPITF